MRAVNAIRPTVTFTAPSNSIANPDSSPRLSNVGSEPSKGARSVVASTSFAFGLGFRKSSSGGRSSLSFGDHTCCVSTAVGMPSASRSVRDVIAGTFMSRAPLLSFSHSAVGSSPARSGRSAGLKALTSGATRSLSDRKPRILASGKKLATSKLPLTIFSASPTAPSTRERPSTATFGRATPPARSAGNASFTASTARTNICPGFAFASNADRR